MIAQYNGVDEFGIKFDQVYCRSVIILDIPKIAENTFYLQISKRAKR